VKIAKEPEKREPNNNYFGLCQAVTYHPLFLLARETYEAQGIKKKNKIKEVDSMVKKTWRGWSRRNRRARIISAA